MQLDVKFVNCDNFLNQSHMVKFNLPIYNGVYLQPFSKLIMHDQVQFMYTENVTKTVSQRPKPLIKCHVKKLKHIASLIDLSYVYGL